MKKITLLLLFGLIVQVGFSQSTLYVFSKKPENITPANWCQIGDYEYKYTISHDMGVFSIPEDQVLVSVDYLEGYNDDPENNCNGPCGQFGWYCDAPSDLKEKTLHPFEILQIEYDGPDILECGTVNCLPLDYFSILLPNLDPGDTDRCLNQPLFEQYEDGQNHNVINLTWQYINKNNEWVDIPQFRHRYPLNVSVEEIFGENYKTFFEGNLQLTYTVTAPFTDVVLASDQYFTFSIIGCSPGLDEIITHKTSCPGKNDGNFTINLDRNLYENEKLYVSLYDDANDALVKQIGNIASLVDNQNETFGYVWPKNLAQGTYYIKYQTRFDDEQEPDNDSWNSLIPSDVFKVEDPDPITFSLQKLNDVYCYGGSDGRIKITAQGGNVNNYQYRINGGDWKNFAQQNSHTLVGLSPGDYEIEVQHASGCMGIPNGETQMVITEPDDPVEVELTAFQTPTAYGFTNGSITVLVTGGTKGYTFEWKDGNNTIINTTTAVDVQEGYQITVENIPAGIYTVTVKDSKYGLATQTEGCTQLLVHELAEPPPLALNVEQTMFVSCNSANTFNNPSNDGQLTATTSGGVPFDPLIDGLYAYKFIWKKKDAQNNWQVLPNEHGNVLNNVEAGEYAVNIEDANGITIGTYVENVLEQAEDLIVPVAEPDLLQVQIEKTDVSCFNGNDGTAIALISGGTAPYEVFWSMGAFTESVENLIAGTYIVYVMDALGCEISGQVTIEQAGGLDIQITEQKNPTCYSGDDGSIAVEVTGGTAPYMYLWDNEETTVSISALTEGLYALLVTDAGGCKAYVEVALESPSPILVDLGKDRTLCKGQFHDMDITIDDPNAIYEWTSTNGFHSTSPNISVADEGTYTAKVTTGQGCIGTDTIEILRNNVDMDAEFLITSQVFATEEVVLVNTSNPLGTSEDWMFPENAIIVEKSPGFIVVRFDDPGVYEVTLRNHQYDCYEDYTKSIVVAEARQLPDVGDAISPFIKEFKVFPNPSTGSFTVALSLQEESSVSLRLFGFGTNQLFDDRQLQGNSDYEISYSMNLASGVYLLVLETAKENQFRKIVVL